MMVTRYGFSEKIGLVNCENEEDEVFIGRDLAHTRSYSDAVANSIDEEVRSIIEECYGKAKNLLEEHRDVLEACAELLLEKERITRDEFETLFVREEA